MSLPENLVIFFDGDCPLCNQAVRLIHKYDKGDKFYYSPLDSSFARLNLPAKYLALDTIQFKVADKIFIRSDAVIEILNILFSTKLFNLFKILPKFMRDGLYITIARLRYKLFKKKNSHFHVSLEKKIIR